MMRTTSTTVTTTLEEERVKNATVVPEYKMEIVWFNVIVLALLHAGALYGFYLAFHMSLITFVWAFVYGYAGGFGITGGSHRLWTHRSYKAKLPLRIILMLCICAAGQNSIYDWVRDHRVHHKFSETDTDPHNAKRGFFFAHVGWLMVRKHPEVLRRGKEIDMGDILQDPVVNFQLRYFTPLKMVMCFIIPTIVPPLLCGETWCNSFFYCLFRYVLLLNFIWLVNSAAHLWGRRPFDKRINPAENWIVSFVGIGEGWHNYHHTFPWDYKAAEFGNFINFTAFLIDLFAKIGWAYDLKSVPPEIVKRVVQKHGDGSHFKWGQFSEIGNPEE